MPNRNSRCCLLTWKSCKVKRVVSSTYDAETIALELGLEEALVIKNQLETLTGLRNELIRVEAFVDCKDTYEAIISNKQFPKGSRLASHKLISRTIKQFNSIQPKCWTW